MSDQEQIDVPEDLTGSAVPAVFSGPYRRFSLLPDGIIACQMQETNPLPGPSVARLCGGVHWMMPTLDLIAESIAMLGVRPEIMQEWLDEWVPFYIHETLPFTKADDTAPEHLRPLLAQLAEAGGIAERSGLVMPDLTADDRAFLRSKGLRLGPVHIYYHAILKPAPLTLRALLWATFHNMTHPLPYPRPGVTSYTWPDDVTPEKEIQHWFGYPLYARRACRVDRIDKIICDVYDSAAKGVFTVKNAWAEWLGCKVEDICAILSELGHIRIDTAIAEMPPEAKAEDGAAKPAAVPIQFRLKSDKPRQERTPRPDRPKKPFKPRVVAESEAPPPRTHHNKKAKHSRDDSHYNPKAEAKFRDQERSKSPAFAKKAPQKPIKKYGDETPLTASPFAHLKDMLGQ